MEYEYLNMVFIYSAVKFSVLKVLIPKPVVLNFSCKIVGKTFLRCLGDIFDGSFPEMSWIHLCFYRLVGELDYMTVGYKYEIISFLILNWNINRGKI